MSDLEVRSIPFGRPWITDEDRAAVAEVLGGHILTHGPQCKAFEAEFGAFLGDGAHCVAVSSCMAALHLACLEFKFGPGDEVIVPAETHVAAVHAVEWVGATPVFVDPDANTGNLTADRVAAAVTPRTKGIIVVHFVGIPCDMPAIVSVAERHRLVIIEDCAIALGARYDGVHVGMFGDAGCFSFYPVKHITTGEGGMLVTRRPEVAAKVLTLRAFGVDRTHTERAIPGMYDVPTCGLNYRMSEMQAALGRSQLRRIHENLARRRSNFTILCEALRGMPRTRIVQTTDNRAETSPYCLSLVLDEPLRRHRDALVTRLNAAGVGTSIYYPQPVPRMTYYREKYGYDPDRFTHAAAISDGSVALPVGPHLDDADAACIGTTVRAILGQFQ